MLRLLQLHIGVTHRQTGSLRERVFFLLHLLEVLHGFVVPVQMVVGGTQHIHVRANKLLFLVGGHLGVTAQVVSCGRIVLLTEGYLTQNTVEFTVVGALRLILENLVRPRLYLLEMTVRVLDLHDVERYGLGVSFVGLQLFEGRQGFVVLLLFVHAIRIVIRAARLVTTLVFGKDTEIDGSALELLLHQVRVSAIEGVILLMRTRERLDIYRFQELQSLLITAFLHLQHALHELHFVLEGGVRISLQVGLEIALQQLIPPVETGSQGIVVLLHLARLSGEGSN